MPKKDPNYKVFNPEFERSVIDDVKTHVDPYVANHMLELSRLLSSAAERLKKRFGLSELSVDNLSELDLSKIKDVYERRLILLTFAKRKLLAERTGSKRSIAHYKTRYDRVKRKLK